MPKKMEEAKKEEEKEEEQRKEERRIKGIKAVIETAIDLPLIHYRKASNLAESVIGDFSLSISFIIISFVYLDWFKASANILFFKGYLLLTAIILYIIAIFDWLQGNTILCFINFIFSLLFMVFYLENIDLRLMVNDFVYSNSDNIRCGSIFYILWFCILLVITISSYRKGYMFIIDYVILAVSFIFLFVYSYWEKDWMRKESCYLLLVEGALFWITGMLRIMNDSGFSLPLVEHIRDATKNEIEDEIKKKKGLGKKKEQVKEKEKEKEKKKEKEKEKNKEKEKEKDKEKEKEKDKEKEKEKNKEKGEEGKNQEK